MQCFQLQCNAMFSYIFRSLKVDTPANKDKSEISKPQRNVVDLNKKKIAALNRPTNIVSDDLKNAFRNTPDGGSNNMEGGRINAERLEIRGDILADFVNR